MNNTEPLPAGLQANPSILVDKNVLRLHVDMLRAISPGRTILINLPGNTRAALIPPVILKYLSLFERAMQEVREWEDEA